MALLSLGALLRRTIRRAAPPDPAESWHAYLATLKAWVPDVFAFIAAHPQHAEEVLDMWRDVLDQIGRHTQSLPEMHQTWVSCREEVNVWFHESLKFVGRGPQNVPSASEQWAKIAYEFEARSASRATAKKAVPRARREEAASRTGKPRRSHVRDEKEAERERHLEDEPQRGAVARESSTLRSHSTEALRPGPEPACPPAAEAARDADRELFREALAQMQAAVAASKVLAKEQARHVESLVQALGEVRTQVEALRQGMMTLGQAMQALQANPNERSRPDAAAQAAAARNPAPADGPQTDLPRMVSAQPEEPLVHERPATEAPTALTTSPEPFVQATGTRPGASDTGLAAQIGYAEAAFVAWCRGGGSLLSRHYKFAEQCGLSVEPVYRECSSLELVFTAQAQTPAEYWLVREGVETLLFPQPLSASSFRDVDERLFDGVAPVPAALTSVTACHVKRAGTSLRVAQRGRIG